MVGFIEKAFALNKNILGKRGPNPDPFPEGGGGGGGVVKMYVIRSRLFSSY